MKKVIRALVPFLMEITRDFMMAACLIGPILVGIIFRFFVPMAETQLCAYFGRTQLIAPYYIVFDLLLAILTPIMSSFAGAMVLLEELDCGTARYCCITPLGRGGYLFSRIALPSLFATVYGLLLLYLFNLSAPDAPILVLLTLSGGLVALTVTLTVVTLAKNKMEGMAIIKLCGLMFLGLPAAYLISQPVRYLFGILPSFWMAELCITGNYLCFGMVLLLSCLGAWGLYAQFCKRLF